MKKKLKGKVVSDKMDKAIVVAVTRLVTHPIYNKKYRVTKKIKVQDAENKYKIGDEVTISETKPISKDIRWKVENDSTTNKTKNRR